MKKIFMILLFFCTGFIKAEEIIIVLKDEISGKFVQDAVISLIDENQKTEIFITDNEGRVKIKARKNNYKISFTHISYITSLIEINLSDNIVIERVLIPKSHTLKEVVITASEDKGLGSISHIGHEAMQHLQPTSFNDLLELLP